MGPCGQSAGCNLYIVLKRAAAAAVISAPAAAAVPAAAAAAPPPPAAAAADRRCCAPTAAAPVAAAAVAKGRRCRQARNPRAATAATTSRLTDSDGATGGRRIICHSRQPRPFRGTLCRSHRAKVAISALLYALSVASDPPRVPHAWRGPLPAVPPFL